MKIVLPHLAWLVVAAAAFAFGKFQGESGDSAKASGGAGGGPVATKTVRPGSGTGMTGGDAAGGSRAGGAGRLAARAVDMTATEIGTAVTTILGVSDPIERQKRFAELLESLTAENAAAAVEALRGAPRSRWSWGQEYSLLTYAWGRLDGPAALAYAQGLEGRTKEWTMGTVLSGWANQDPDGARAWVESVEDPDERSRVTRGLVSGLAQRDVAAATEYVYSLAESGAGRTSEYMDTIVRQQLTRGLESAASWADLLPDGDLKGTALERVANEYVRKDPLQAAEWVTQYASQGFATEAVGEVAEEWAEDDPKAALGWAEELEKGAARNRAVAEAVSEWADRDALAAGDYVTSLPAGDERDAAAGAYARRIADEDPTAAVDWALSIEGESLRNSTVASTVREWMLRDPSAAGQWVETAGLPESVVTEIKQPQDGRRRWWGR